MPAVDTRELRNALGAFATGVTIVTARDAAGRDVGVTANSFSSVSLDPPLVLWSLARSSSSFPVFEAASHFAVHVLASDQQALSVRFAQRGVDRFAGLELQRGPGDVALIDGCAARFECRSAYRYEGGDHLILVGEVLRFEHFHKKPLAFFAGRYALALHRPQAQLEAELAADAAEGCPDRDGLSDLLRRVSLRLQARLEQRLAPLGLDAARAEALIAVLRDESSAAEAEVAHGFSAQGWLAPAGEGAWQLSDPGRALALQALALLREVEQEAEAGLDEVESPLLHHLLRHLSRQLGQGSA